MNTLIKVESMIILPRNMFDINRWLNWQSSVIGQCSNDPKNPKVYLHIADYLSNRNVYDYNKNSNIYWFTTHFRQNEYKHLYMAVMFF